MAFKNLTNSPKVGRIVKKTFESGQPSGTTLSVTGLTTVTFTNGVMRAVGGSGDFIDYTQNFKVDRVLMADKVENLCVFKPIVAGSGFILRRVESATGSSNWLRIELTNDGRKGLVTWGYNASVNTITTQLSTFTYDGEILYVREIFDKQIGGHFMEIGYYKENGAFNINLRTPVDRTQAWNTQICFIGGTIDFYELSVKLNIARNPKILGIGDSNMFNYDASGIQAREWDTGYIHNLQRMTNVVIEEISFAGAKIDDHTLYLDLVLEINPEYVLINDGTNSMLQGSTLASYQTKYLAYCQVLLNAGIKIIHFGSFPGNPVGVLNNYVAWNAWKASLVNGTTQFYVDCYTALKAPASDNLNPTYWGGAGVDGTHVSRDYQYIVSNDLYPKLKAFINI